LQQEQIPYHHQQILRYGTTSQKKNVIDIIRPSALDFEDINGISPFLGEKRWAGRKLGVEIQISNKVVAESQERKNTSDA
jgi:hypothetical protein